MFGVGRWEGSLFSRFKTAIGGVFEEGVVGLEFVGQVHYWLKTPRAGSSGLGFQMVLGRNSSGRAARGVGVNHCRVRTGPGISMPIGLVHRYSCRGLKVAKVGTHITEGSLTVTTRGNRK